MKKKHLSFILCLMVLTIGSAIFSGCGSKGDKESLFSTHHITMQKEQEINIADFLTESISGLKFESSNNSVAFVSPSGKLQSGSEEGVAIITIKGYLGALEVEVVGTTHTFSVPTNLTYNNETSVISWNTVYFENFPAVSYELSLTKNGNEQIIPLQSNSYKIEGVGEYQVKVKACARGEINASEYSNVLSFSKLSKPHSLVYDDITHTLSWDADSDVTAFYIKKNGVLSELITGKSTTLYLEQSKQYTISVVSALEEQIQNVYGQDSESLSLTRLKSPNVQIQNGAFVWLDNQSGVMGYSLEVYDSKTNQTVFTDFVSYKGNSYSYKLSGITAGTYKIAIRAIGDGNLDKYNQNTNYLSSATALSQEVVKLEKLALVFEPNLDMIKVANFDAGNNFKINLYSKYNNITTGEDISENGQFVGDYKKAGMYEIYVINKAVNANEIDADPSNTLFVQRLATLDKLTQSVNSNGEYVLSGLELEDATSFTIEKWQGGLSTPLNQVGGKYGIADELFADAGDYEIVVTANGDNTTTKMVLPSKTTLLVHRLKDIEMADNGKKITWDKASDFEQEIYSYILSGAMQDSGELGMREFDYSSLEVGAYTLKLKAKATGVVSNTLVLESLNYAEIDFKIERTLNTPLLSLSKEQDKYFLNIGVVDNAGEFEILVNDKPLTKDGVAYVPPANVGSETKIDVTKEFASMGFGENNLIYEFKVTATNSANNYLLDATPVVLRAEKLVAPKSFVLSATEVISAPINKAEIAGSQVYINGQETSTLAPEIKDFTVKINYTANAGEFDGVYYIDSHFAEFKLHRQEINVNAKGLTLNWTANNENFIKNIHFVQDGEELMSRELTEFTSYDLGTIIGFLEPKATLLTGINAYIEYSLVSLNETLQGEYVDGGYVSGVTDGDKKTLQVFDIGSRSKDILLKYADANAGVTIAENDTNVDITWNKKLGITYEIYDGTNLHTNISGATTLSVEKSLYNNEQTHTLSLFENGDSFNIYIFNITKLKTLNEFTVGENDQIEYLAQKGAQKANFVFGASEIASVKQITGSAVITAQYLALNDNNYDFYLNSNKTEFTVQRLIPLDVSGNLKIENDLISWSKEEEFTEHSEYEYSVVFFNGEMPRKEFTKILAVENSTIIDPRTYQAELDTLVGEKYFVITKNVKQNTIKLNGVNYLSSPKSETKALKLVDKPTNITATAVGDLVFQNSIKISWSTNLYSGMVIEHYIVNFKCGNFQDYRIETGEFVILPTEEFLDTAGEWEITIKAVGAGDTISSLYSEPQTFVRLATPQNVKIDNDYVISWEAVSNAVEYLVKCFYETPTGTVELADTLDSDTLVSNVLKNAITNDFSGDVNVCVYAIGDGENYFTSGETVLVYERLAKPDLVFENDRIVIANYDSYPSGTEFYLTGQVGDNLVLDGFVKIEPCTDSNWAYFYPESYTYTDQSGKNVSIDTSINNDITYTLYAQNTTGQLIKSNVATKQITILATLYDLGFIRDESGALKFSAKNPDTVVGKAQLEIETINAPLDSQNTFEFDEEVLKLVKQEWMLMAYAVGGTVDGKVYANSVKATLGGKKVATPTNLTTNEGYIVWDSVARATSYTLKIDDLVKAGYEERREGLLGEEYSAGTHNVSVRAIGNVDSTLRTLDIVLDGDYSSVHSITKLETMTDLKVDKGLFTFKVQAGATRFVIEVYEDLAKAKLCSLDLSIYKLPIQNSASHYSSSELAKLLESYDQLYIKFLNKTDNPGYVYSNYALIDGQDYLIVKTFKNATAKLDIYNPIIEETQTIDYATAMAKWEQNPISNAEYLVRLDGEDHFEEGNTFVIDPNSKLSAGTHTISHTQLGTTGVGEDRIVYIPAPFSTEITLTKLPTVNLKVATFKPNSYEEIGATFTPIPSANRYLCYLNDTLAYDIEGPNSITGIDFSGLAEGQEYSKFGVKAINTSSATTLASSMSYLCNTGTTPLPIQKLPALSDIKFEDGSFFVEYDSLYMAENLSVLVDQKIEIKFTSIETGKEYVFTNDLYRFIKVSDAQIQEVVRYIKLLQQYGYTLPDEYLQFLDDTSEIRKNLKGGFANLEYGFRDFAVDLPSGQYDISLKQIGDYIWSDGTKEVMKLTSNYHSIGTKYVGASTSLTAVKEGDNHYLTFNNVNVNQDYFASAPSYDLVGEKQDGTRVILDTIEAEGVNDGKTIKYCISNLVNERILTEEYIALYITLKGNSQNILNGKPSNIMKINVLSAVETRVQDGVIVWTAQQLASKFKVMYTLDGTEIQEFIEIECVEGQNEYSWIGSELVGGEHYNVVMLAVGTLQETTKVGETLTISGKLTNIGLVGKLASISDVVNGVAIEKGQFSWAHIDNATAYEITYSNEKGEKGKDRVETNFYESTANNNDINTYKFMAVGTEKLDLNETTTCYLNSQISKENYAAKAVAVESITYKNGIIYFEPKVLTNYYKLTFKKTNNASSTNDTVVVFTKETNFDTNSNESLATYGYYSLSVQALYEQRTALKNEDNAFYILSANLSSVFYKLDEVTNINVTGGKVIWSHANWDNLKPEDFVYTLHFSAKIDGVEQQRQIVVESDKKEFEQVVFDNISTTDDISVKIFVTPTYARTKAFVHSISTAYPEVIHQYKIIDETQIEIKMTEDNQILIDWSKGTEGYDESFNYEIKCSVDGKEDKIIKTTNPWFKTGDELSFNIQGEYTLEISIRVIPTTKNYISSAWTAPREISRPKTVTGLAYDTETHTLTWDAYEATNNLASYVYKIRDTVTFTNALGETETEVYIFNVNASTQNANSYTPFVQGTHKFAVAVIINNATESEQESFVSEYAMLENDVVFEIFETGLGSKDYPYIVSKGTSEYPYIISNAEQFANIALRMTKDSKLNSYYKGTVDELGNIVDTTLYTSAEKVYYFKQANHFALEKSASVDETLYALGVFNGVYDADHYSITLNYTHTVGEKDYQHVSLFGQIGTSGAVTNLMLLFNNLSAESKISSAKVGDLARFALLCEVNNGSISNISVGNSKQSGDISIITEGLKVDFALLAYENNGTVQNVQNFYNITIDDSLKNAQRAVQYATFAIINNGTVQYAKNNGNLTFKGSELIVGGIVGFNASSASVVSASANIGAINIVYRTNKTSIVGAVVAENRGLVEYVYATTAFTVKDSSTATIGGLVGSWYSGQISNSYVDVTKDVTSVGTLVQVYQVAGSMGIGTGLAVNVYYRDISGFPAVNGSGEGFTAYTGDVATANTTLFGGTASLFNSQAKLHFEQTFAEIVWKTIK